MCPASPETRGAGCHPAANPGATAGASGNSQIFTAQSGASAPPLRPFLLGTPTPTTTHTKNNVYRGRGGSTPLAGTSGERLGRFWGGKEARGAPWAHLKAAPGRQSLGGEAGGLQAPRRGWTARAAAATFSRTCILRTYRCTSSGPTTPGSGQEGRGVAGLGGTAEGWGARRGWAARRRSAVRPGAGDTPTMSAACPLVPGSVGRAVSGLPWARPLLLREENAGEAPSPCRP